MGHLEGIQRCHPSILYIAWFLLQTIEEYLDHLEQFVVLLRI